MRRFPDASQVEQSISATNQEAMMNDLDEHTGQATQVGRPTAVELAARRYDGLEVTLLWSRRSGALRVEVLHVATRERFTIDADQADALDVYYHPFAYSLGGGRELAAAA
jgi:hypothetical protein